MSEAERQTRSYLMEMFKEHGFNPRTDLGQNFLIDLNIVEFVAENGEIEPRDVVLEVGAGTGGMTTYLAEDAAAVVSVELDRNMYGLAKKAIEGFDNVDLLNCDALKNKNQLSPQVVERIEHHLAADPKRKLKLIANLPYSVATPIISNLVASDLPWSRMVVTIQLELGLRMTSRPRTGNYGALAVWLQSQCGVKLLKKLPPTVFWPRPKVNSAVVRLLPRPDLRKKIDDRPFLQDFARRLFHQRRKFMRSVLAGMYRRDLSKPELDVILGGMNLKTNTRAEELAVPTLVELANRIRAAIVAKSETPSSAASE